MKKALITGITGQDGSYLAELLLEKGYEVHGIIRRASVSTTARIDHIMDKITIHEGDLSDSSSIIRIVLQVKPDEIYNLAAQSHVQVSFDAAEYTGDVDALGVLRILEVDVLVIGSDEVFNCTQAGENVGYSPELFGKNARAKKIITYAASFGDTTYDKLQRYGVTDDLMKWVSRINNISVRDNNSKEIITSLCKKTPIINLDPVLVGNIEKLKWKKPDLEYEYIVLYGYEYRFSKEECDKILHFAKSENCKVIALGERQFKSDIFIKCRPDEVLGYFSEAKYIITDTFHGSIFSIINHKKFVSLIRKATPQSSGNRQKLGFLLEQLYLQERLINSIDELSEKMHKNIDYVNVDKIREEERNKTMKYLENCIGER